MTSNMIKEDAYYMTFLFSYSSLQELSTSDLKPGSTRWWFLLHWTCEKWNPLLQRGMVEAYRSLRRDFLLVCGNPNLLRIMKCTGMLPSSGSLWAKTCWKLGGNRRNIFLVLVLYSSLKPPWLATVWGRMLWQIRLGLIQYCLFLICF